MIIAVQNKFANIGKKSSKYDIGSQLKLKLEEMKKEKKFLPFGEKNPQFALPSSDYESCHGKISNGEVKNHRFLQQEAKILDRETL